MALWCATVWWVLALCTARWVTWVAFLAVAAMAGEAASATIGRAKASAANRDLRIGDTSIAPGLN